MDDLHTSAQGHTPRLTAEPSQEGIMRIQEMERRLEEAVEAVEQMEEALGRYEAAQEAVERLAGYLDSEEWRRDFADDEKGLLPADLKRGVLSEDGIWNLLDNNRELATRMQEISDKILTK
ncbi:MAG: DUF4298 domain-containing protein [Bacteroidales bacterium]|nr:DUF4298 domain-containing protein [Bacteroidales bacterium]